MRPSHRTPVHYLIIGNSAAGIAAARAIRRGDASGRITMMSDEPSLGYSRVLLPEYIAGHTSKRSMVIAPRSFYAGLKIRLLRDDAAEGADPAAQRVWTRSGIQLGYDRLLIATGASPRPLDIPGSQLQGVHTLRTLRDAEAIRAALTASRGPVLVVGGGLVSLRSAEALIARRRKVHLMVASERVLSQVLDGGAARLVLDALERHGVHVHLQTEVTAFEGRTCLESAVLSDGTSLECALAIVGKGVRPNIGFLRGAGIAIDGGVVIDSHMATNVPGVYAAGDVARSVDLLSGKPAGFPIWPVAVEGGRIAGSNMAGMPTRMPEALRMNALELFGTRLVSVGNRDGERALESGRGSQYRRLVFTGNQLRGFVLAGDIEGAGILTALVRNRTDVGVSSLLASGLRRGLGFWPRLQALGGRPQALMIAADAGR